MLRPSPRVVRKNVACVYVYAGKKTKNKSNVVRDLRNGALSVLFQFADGSHCDYSDAEASKSLDIHPEALYKTYRTQGACQNSPSPALAKWLAGNDLGEMLRDWQGYRKFGTIWLIIEYYIVLLHALRRPPFYDRHDFGLKNQKNYNFFHTTSLCV